MTHTPDGEQGKMNRRGFLLGIGAGAGAAGAALVAAPAAAQAADAQDGAAGYRETEHVKSAYRCAAF